jgi:ADP-heptose:LPS heptosyltransferase
MYLLYAPPEKFSHLPPKTALISEEVLFTHNIAYCPKFFWKKFHLMQGIRDITPNWMKRKRQTRILNNILILATGGMGDSMWVMPFAKQLRIKYPRARILIATEERNMPLWQGVPYADTCVKDEFWNLQNLIRTADEVWDFGGVATMMKKEMRLDPIEAIFKIAEEPLPKDRKDCRPMLVMTIDEGKAIEAVFSKKNVDTKKDKIISIGLNTSTPNRDWPIEYVKEITAQFIHDGFKVVWLSDKLEYSQEKSEGVFFETGLINFSGQISIRQSMATIALSDLYIGPNSALMVIATAMNIPTVGLFGAFSPKTRIKFYDKFTAVVGKYKCSPCNEHWTECPEGHPAPCMKNISPIEAYSAAQALLKKWPRTQTEKRPIE